MPDGLGAPVPMRRARRWPSVVVVLLVAFSVALTSFLFVRDRQNADAATDSRANAGQDALALAAVQSLARTLDLDASLRRSGVVGLRPIGLADFTSLLVGPLGGAVEQGPSQWTVALGGGFACLTWLHGTAAGGMATATRGVCTDNAPLLTSPPITVQAFHTAELEILVRERVAVDAAVVAAAISSSSAGYDPPFSLPALTARFSRLAHVPFRSWPTSVGLTVATRTSQSCLLPTPSDAQVRVLLGGCD